MDRPNIIERAYDLARMGRYLNQSEIACVLKREGFEGVEAHLSGAATRKMLNAMCKAAKATAN